VTDDLTRCYLFTEALPRGIGCLLRGVLQFRRGIHEWGSAEVARLYGWAVPSSELVDALRGLGESMHLVRVELAERSPTTCSIRATATRSSAGLTSATCSGGGRSGGG
jgi:hypothetical protein